MPSLHLRPRPRRLASALLLGLGLAGATSVTGCGALEVADPTALEESELNNAEGAALLWRDALRQLYVTAASSAWESGVLADEFLFNIPGAFYVPLADGNELLDRRETALYEERNPWSEPYRQWQQLRAFQASAALPKLRAYALPGAREARVGEVYAARGFAALRTAEDYCPGLRLYDAPQYTFVEGPPLSTEEALALALADFDTAAAVAADSSRVLHFARVGRGRTLLNLGRYAEAASAVAEVPTGYLYQAQYNGTTTPSQPNILGMNSSGWGTQRSVADRQGGVGLDFVSAQDPRVGTTRLGTARDTVTGLYGINKYPTFGSPLVLASGVEARLIQAEAELRANPGGSQWLTILNELRAPSGPNSGGVAGLAPLSDPGTDAARVDLLFRERAFWLFATGHRLADLRRLIRQYGRQRESVFPTGPYHMGGAFGLGTSLPFGQAGAGQQQSGCTSF